MENTTVLNLNAYYTTEYSGTRVAGQPQGFKFNATLDTREDAVAFVALFPKSSKMFATTLHTANGPLGYAMAQGNLFSDGVNGGINETGLNRYRAILKAAAKNGIEIRYVANAGNAYESREAFEAAIS